MTDQPKPFGYVRDGNGGPLVFQHAPFDALTHLVCSTAPVYSYAQLREAMEAAAQQEREQCKQLAESYPCLSVDSDAVHSACKMIAAAIRARSEEGNQK